MSDMIDPATLPPNLQAELTYISDSLKPLVGAKILGASAALSDDEFDGMQAWPMLTVLTVDGTTLDVIAQCDPEGNGPGHLSLEPHS